jgi:hypothetical protein
LIDEIQSLDDPSNFLKLIFDKYNKQLKIIATGSSAFFIDRKFGDDDRSGISRFRPSNGLSGALREENHFFSHGSSRFRTTCSRRELRDKLPFQSINKDFRLL